MNTSSSSATQAGSTSALVITAHPLLGVAGVLTGEMISTCAGRLLSVGLADLRGGWISLCDAGHCGEYSQLLDLCSWLPSASDMICVVVGRCTAMLTQSGGHVAYEGVRSKIDPGCRIYSCRSRMPCRCAGPIGMGGK